MEQNEIGNKQKHLNRIDNKSFSQIFFGNICFFETAWCWQAIFGMFSSVTNSRKTLNVSKTKERF